MISRRDINRAIRIAVGKSQKEIGEMAGVTGSTVARYESGATDMAPASIKVIEWAIGDMLNKLGEVEKCKVKLAANAILLMEVTNYIDKAECLQSIMYNSSMILREETNSMKFGCNLIKKKED